MPFTPTRVAAAVLVLALGSTLTACSSGEDSSVRNTSAGGTLMEQSDAVAQAPAADAAAASAPAAADEAAPAAEVAATAGRTYAKATKTAGATKADAKTESARIAAGAGKGSAGNKLSIAESALDGRIIAYTAEQTIEVDDVGKAVSQIEAAVDAAGGLIALSSIEEAESSGGEPAAPGKPKRPASANLKLRIPPGAFESFLARVEKIGTVLERTTTGDDVTDQVVDVRSRIASARKSVERVRILMDRATTLRDVVALESEVSSREAELEALLARQSSLKKRTDLASVTVHLQSTDAPAPPPAPVEKTQQGFTAGLDDGWDAFTGSATALATVLGALLPFAILLLVLAPLLLVVYRRQRRAGQFRDAETA